MCGTTHKTVKRIIESDGVRVERVGEAANYELVRALVAAKVDKTVCKITAPLAEVGALGRTPRGRPVRPRPFHPASAQASPSKGRTSTLPRHAFDPSAASVSATSRSGASITQKPPMTSLVSR